MKHWVALFGFGDLGLGMGIRPFSCISRTQHSEVIDGEFAAALAC